MSNHHCVLPCSEGMGWCELGLPIVLLLSDLIEID